jgi:hypothetical protein
MKDLREYYLNQLRVADAFKRWNSGEEGSDEECASALLYLRQIREVTIPEALQSAEEVGVSFLQRAVSAADDDPDFFRRIAGILEHRKRHPKNRSAIAFIFRAYWRLTQDPLHDPKAVTKKTVKTLALKLWAFSRLAERKKLSGEFPDELTHSQKAMIQQEIACLPQQRWQDLWPIAALEDLPGSKRGPNSI